MIDIHRATKFDAALIAEIAQASFLSSHKDSAPISALNSYVSLKFNLEAIQDELSHPSNHFFLLSNEQQPVGFAKVQLQTSWVEGESSSLMKLERFYFSPNQQGKGLGTHLFNFLKDWATVEHQSGIWLYVWVGNVPAIKFYTKKGFNVVGSHDFAISVNHSNPNHRMCLYF